jgi:hypothetical protein
LVRKTFDEEHNFREEILEKYLGTVGYWRWERLCAEEEQNVVDPLFLNLKVIVLVPFYVAFRLTGFCQGP